MVLSVTVRPDAPALKHFTAEQLDAIAKSLVVTLAPGDEIVHFSTNPPFDTRKRWQPLDSYGVPVGQIRTFNGNDWT